MSKYVECKTLIKSREALIEALKEMGYTIFEEGENLSMYDYHGQLRPQKANVVIRRQHVRSAANDLGFKRNENGTYTVIISEFDQSQDPKFVENVTRLSSIHNTINAMQKRGYKTSRSKDPNVTNREILEFTKY